MEWSASRSAAALISPRSCSGSAAINRAFRGGSGSCRDPEEQRGAPPQSKTNASALLWVNLCKPLIQLGWSQKHKHSVWLDQCLCFSQMYTERNGRGVIMESIWTISGAKLIKHTAATQQRSESLLQVYPAYTDTHQGFHTCLSCVIIIHWCLKRYILKS